VRSPSAEYLESAKLEELVSNLQSKGYRVVTEARLGDETFDLLAERGDERVAYEVKARSRLKESTEQVARLREAALEAGLTEFRLVVVNPPHQADVTIEDLRYELLRYFQENETPTELDELSSGTQIEDVTDIEFELVDIRRSSIHVRGQASAEVELNYSGCSERDGLTVSDSFPLSFDLELDRNLRIITVNELHVDTSAFYE
jgi:Holliday junction resolvase